jgi:hypothetical protein
MAFDSKSFKRAAFEPRIQVVKVPELAEFFPDGEPAEFTVRGLTGMEIAACAAEYNKYGLIVQALEQGKASKEQIKDIFGDEDKATAEMMRDYKLLKIVLGLDLDIAKKINANFPSVFKRLTSTVWILTDKGAEIKKKQPSCSGNPEHETA